MTSPGSGYIALPQDEVTEPTTMVAASPPPLSTTSGGAASGSWRRSDVGQLPVSFSSEVELDELTSASSTTLTTVAVSPPPSAVARDQSRVLLAKPPPPPPLPPFQVGNSSATSHVKRRLE